MRGKTGRWTGATARVAIAAAGAAAVAWGVSPDASWAERHILPSYCATNGAEWAAARSVRWVAALAVLAVVAAAPALFRWVRRASLRGRAGSAAAVVIAIVASLCVTELYMRRLHARLALGARPLFSPGGTSMTRADSRLGWVYLPDRTTWVEVAGRRIAYAIDAEGERRASNGDLPRPDVPTVLFTGESIAFGYGLPYEETIPSLVGRDLGVQTVDLAVVGYGSDQAHLRVVGALPRFAAPVAVVTLFVPDQIKRNVDIWRPRLALAPDGSLAPVPPSTGLAIARLAQQLPYRGGEALRVTSAILRATAEAARARGAYPLFVVTNYGSACLHADGAEPWIVDELFVRQGLPFVRVDLGPEDRLPGVLEGHPSLRGTRKIAGAVERALAAPLGRMPVSAR